MPRLRFGMRWWLAALFVLIAVLAAALVAAVSSRQADTAVRENSEELAVGKTVTAGFLVERAISHGTLGDSLPLIAGRRGLALFVFAANGRLITPDTSNGVAWQALPRRRLALTQALSGRRFVSSSSGATVAGLPLRRTQTAAALVAYAPRPAAYNASLAIFRREVARALLWAVLAAAVAGLLAATLIARRLRRIGAAATAIERGDLETELQRGFPDEIGALAGNIDRMRRRLHLAFDQLRTERDRLDRLLEQLHEGVVAVDRDLSVHFVNRAGRRMLGLASDETSPLPDAWHDLYLHHFALALFRADAEPASARVTTSDEQVLFAVGLPARGSDLAVIVVSDITEQERRERAEREFVANASHELRTPVTAIAGAVEALEAGAKDSSADRDVFIALIGRQTARLSRLTRSLLVLARAQTRQQDLDLEAIELRPLLQEVAETSHGNGGVTLDCPSGLVALAHRDMTEQVVGNLLENALSHSGGSPVVLRAQAAGDDVVIEVADRGPGIPVAIRDRIFDRFYSAGNGRRDGFGLGLAIARDAVQAQGGTIELDSSRSGTVARVTLAAARRR